MKLIDTCIYFDEDMLLDIRLNLLNKYVDKFIIVESAYTFQGKKKSINFKINNFKKFENKIEHHIIEKFPNNLSIWGREFYQRNYISNCIKKFDENDLIIISDVDEIPNLENQKKFKSDKYYVFEQQFFYYKLNLLNITEPKWYGSKISSKKKLKSPQWLRNQKIKPYPFWRFDKIKFDIIKNGGWHFSYLKSPEKIKEKIESFSHTEFNQDKYKNINTIEELIEKKVDLFGRNMEFKPIDFKKNFPKYLIDKKSLYKDWIV